MKHAPDLSIIVPTRNRYVTALACAKQVLTCEGNFELIVRDCSDSDKLREALENLQDERIRYDYQQPPISMTDNWEAAIALARGDYICIIGDDDGINPITPKIVGYLKELGIEALVPSSLNTACYWWPDFPSEDTTKLTVEHCLGNLRKREITQDQFKQFLRLTQAGYTQYQQCPRIYHGIVARHAVDTLKKLTGRVFKSRGLDVYFAYALTSVMKKHYVVDYPLTIKGSSLLSNSGRLRGSKEERNKHFQEYSNYKCHTLVPPVITATVSNIEAIIIALEDTHRQNLIEFVSVDKLYALTIEQSLSDWKIIVRHLHNEVLADKNIIHKLKIYVGVISYLVTRTVIKIIKIIKKIIKPFIFKLLPKTEKVVTYNAQDINEASVKLLQHLNDSGVTEKVITDLLIYDRIDQLSN